MVDELCGLLREKLEDIHELERELYSLILYGSIVRGDFIPKVSDIDFFAVVRSEAVIPILKEILEDVCRDLEALEVDLAWEYLDNIYDPLNRGYPFKFLTIYQDDFIKHHIVVYGRDIVDMLPRYDAESLIKWRCRFLLNLLERHKGNTKMLHIIAGETARLMAWIESKSLHKEAVLETLVRLGDSDALKIYNAYLDKRRHPYTDGFLIQFVKSRINKILGSYSYTSVNPI